MVSYVLVLSMEFYLSVLGDFCMCVLVAKELMGEENDSMTSGMRNYMSLSTLVSCRMDNNNKKH